MIVYKSYLCKHYNYYICNMSEIEIKDRILKLLTRQNLSSSKFADLVGVQRSSISHILSGRNKPSLDFLQKILSNFPTLNSDWLILGKGEMFIQSNQTQISFDIKKENAPITISPPLFEPKTQVPVAQETNTKELKRRSIKKIVVFYDDNTFEEMKPEKESKD